MLQFHSLYQWFYEIFILKFIPQQQAYEAARGSATVCVIADSFRKDSVWERMVVSLIVSIIRQGKINMVVFNSPEHNSYYYLGSRIFYSKCHIALKHCSYIIAYM